MELEGDLARSWSPSLPNYFGNLLKVDGKALIIILSVKSYLDSAFLIEKSRQ